jgi:zinc protease
MHLRRSVFPNTRAAITVIFLTVLAFVTLQPARAGLFNPQTFRLANGMEVVVIPDHRAPIVMHMVWYKVGAADEPLGKSGIAHFLEHLMFKGTKKIPPGAFSKIVARNGGRDNAFTSLDYTSYFQMVARDRLELVMRMEADRMTNLQLSDKTVLPERQVILEERSQRTDNNPGALLSEYVNAAQFLSHPYGIPVIGWRKEMEHLTTQDALAFYHAHYSPGNAVLVVAGDITAKELKPLAEKYYGVIPATPVPPRVRPTEPPQLAERRVILRNAQVRQPSWSRSYLAPSRSAGKTEYAVPLQVLADILGGGSTSRLYRKLVVDDKLAAGVGAYYSGVSLDRTAFHIYGSPAPGVKVDRIETAIDGVLADLLAKGVTEAEVKRSVNGMLASAIYARDSLRTAARVFGAALTSGLTVEQIEAWPDQVAHVTVDQVNAAARYVLNRKRSVTGVLLPDNKVPDNKGTEG